MSAQVCVMFGELVGGADCVGGQEKELLLVVVVVLLFHTFSVLVANPKNTTLHGDQSRSWSAKQGKK